MNADSESVFFNIGSDVSSSVESLQNLSNTLQSLNNIVTSGTKKINNFTKAIQSLSSINTSQIQNVINNLNQINNFKASNELSKLSNTLENVANMSPKINVKIVNQLGESSKNLKNNMSGLPDTVKATTSALDNLPNSLNKAANEIDNLSNKNQKIKTTADLLSTLSKTFKFSVLAIGLKSLANSIGNFVSLSNDYIENLNLFNVSMGNMADTALEFTENFSGVLGVDPSNVMRYISIFNTLAEGFGIANDEAYKMSKNLTQLSYDLSSYLNIPIDEAMQKLKSGFSGEIEPMRAVGVALDEASLQETAYALGIDKKVSEMTRAQKSELLYYQIMTRTTKMQGDMARTLIQPANALRILQQEFTQLGRAIGNIFIPILMSVIPYVQVLVKWLTAAAQAIASFLGFEIDTSGWDDVTDLAEDIAGGIGDIGDSAAGTTKELKKMLAPFDELNVIDFGDDSKSGGSSGSSVGGGGSLGIPLPDYDATEGAVAKNLEKIEQNLKNLIVPLTTIVGIIAGFKILDWISNLTKLGNTLGWSSTVMSGLGTAASVVASVLQVLGGVLLGWSYASFLDWFSNGNELINNFGIALGLAASVALAFVNPLLGIGTALGILIYEGLQPAVKEVDVFRGVSQETATALQPVIDNVKTLDNTLLELTWSNLAPSEEQIETVKTSIAEIVATYKASFADSYEAYKESINNNMLLSEESKQKLISDAQESYNSQVSSAEETQNRITEIMTNASNEKRALTQEENQEIQDLYNQLADETVRLTSESSDEAQAIIDRMNLNQQAWSKETAAQYIKDSAQVRDQKIKDAEDTYTKTLAYGRATYGEESDQYKELAAIAKNTYDQTVNNAEESHQKVVDSVASNFDDLSKYVDTSTGDIKNGFQTFIDNLIDGFGRIDNSSRDAMQKAKDNTQDFTAALDDAATQVEDINKKLNGTQFVINYKVNKSGQDIANDILNGNKTTGVLATTSVRQYALGGFPDEGEMFIAREKGPELVGTIGRKAAVVNNDQIVESVSQGVYAAVAEANSKNNTRQPINVYIGNKKVYSGYGSYANSENNMYGVNVIR